MNEQQGASPTRSAYEAYEELVFKLHSTSLVLKGLDRLIADGIEHRSADQLSELLEIVWQLTKTTATYVQEAQDVAGEVNFALSGAHP